MVGWKGGGDCGNRKTLYIPVAFGFDRMAQEPSYVFISQIGFMTGNVCKCTM